MSSALDQEARTALERFVQRARRLLGSTALSARDTVHVAIMRRHAVSRILTFDRGFDAIAEIQRD